MSKSDSAKRNLKQAEESLKTGLLKWKPDHTLAAMYYKKAAEDFKALKKYEESNKYFAQANVSTMQVNDLYSAAKNHEAMAQNCKLQCETGPGYGKKFFTDALLNEFMTNLQKAGQYFVQNDNLDSCFHILNRGANAIDNQISQMAYSGGKNLDLGKVGKMTESCCQLLHQAKDALIPQKLERSQDICSNISLIVKIYLRLYNLRLSS